MLIHCRIFMDLLIFVITDQLGYYNIKLNIMNDNSKRVVILLAHPNLNESQANKALADSVKDIDGVMVYDLYEYQNQSFDVNIWSKIISDALMVIFQFPFHWMSAPSLLKRWLDEVFTSLAKTPAVAGKPLQVVTTTGSEYAAYRSGGRNCFTMDELLRPYQGCAIHAGMVWQTPLVVYGMGTSEASKSIAAGAEAYKQKVEAVLAEHGTNKNW